MLATYTVDLFSTLDGYGATIGDWGGYWGKQGPELLERRRELYSEPQLMVFGADTFRMFVDFLDRRDEFPDVGDAWVSLMTHLPATVISSTLRAPLNWPDASLASGDAVEVVTGLKQASPLPLRSHGSLSLNRALLAAGLVDRIQVTVFPVLTGDTGTEPLFAGVDDYDLELLEHRVLDGRTLELTYRPTLHACE
ncbi:dihydrofolate reductase family protein [Propioniciclava coleopterorum]|uniref:Dihydrofolate reductase family protein n=1 Tax=Propioniciclava coleopterorum TaxID=2714937 RepID=A0A6G7Y6U6_9ACTN|nr:dihydrofolate reductase family protein [Propioniciclava coleopterorum]QIK72535.1 dihydrofolate reductase family protein [Propioniciclava coleopterorum]